MKFLSNLSIAVILLTVTALNAQINNMKMESVTIYGNCAMCKANIEKAGNLKNVAQVDWSLDTKLAIIGYDQTKTTKDEILKRIALAGYDNEVFLAPDDVYASLMGCCQYDRPIKESVPKKESVVSMDHKKSMSGKDSKLMMEMDHALHKMEKESIAQEVPQLKIVFDKYIDLKNALVNTDGKAASLRAADMATSIKSVKMEQLSPAEHMLWMLVNAGLSADVKKIAETKETSQQRNYFINLSAKMYELAKVIKVEEPIYYQFCPMANDGKGANWLSKESEVKNPYYGSMMMNCGKTVEVIK